MRKLVVLILVAALLVCSAFAVESAIDLSSMTFDELVALHRQLDAEINARIGCGPSLIAGGVYTAGTTIKSGAYLITCTDAYTEDGVSIQAYSSHEQYEKCRAVYSQYKDDYQLFASNIHPGQSVTISLSDGMVLVIDGGACFANAIAPTWVP